MITRRKLETYISSLLSSSTIRDYCPNGLQIEGKKEISTIISGVTASHELITKAISRNADAILVHHGYFWTGENQPIIGMKYRRISLLMKHYINLFAYHLPLDIHPYLGNNVQLAKLLDLKVIDNFNTDTIPTCGIICQTDTTIENLTRKIAYKLQREPLVVGYPSNDRICRIAICTGAGQNFIENAYHAGAQVYISGEISERTTSIARELGISYISAGHHATERYGIQALGEDIAKKFSLTHHFIDIENPV